MIGRSVLAIGIIVACVYWIRTAPPAPTLDDSNALGYTRSANRQMAKMMGHFGQVMSGWQETLDQPLTQSFIIVAIAALLAAYFFRAAWVMDEEERERHDAQRGTR